MKMMAKTPTSLNREPARGKKNRSLLRCRISLTKTIEEVLLATRERCPKKRKSHQWIATPKKRNRKGCSLCMRTHRTTEGRIMVNTRERIVKESSALHADASLWQRLCRSIKKCARRYSFKSERYSTSNRCAKRAFYRKPNRTVEVSITLIRVTASLQKLLLRTKEDPKQRVHKISLLEARVVVKLRNGKRKVICLGPPCEQPPENQTITIMVEVAMALRHRSSHQTTALSASGAAANLTILLLRGTSPFAKRSTKRRK